MLLSRDQQRVSSGFKAVHRENVLPRDDDDDELFLPSIGLF